MKMKAALMVLFTVALFAMQARADDFVVSTILPESTSAVPSTPTPAESKFSAISDISGFINKSLASEFKDKSVFVIKENNDQFDDFVDSVFVAHGIKLAKQEADADVLVLIDDVGMSYSRDGDQDTYMKYIPIATASDQAATYDLLVANASIVRGPGGDAVFGGSPMAILTKQVIYKIGASDAFANATRSKAKTGPFNQTMGLNITLKIKGVDGRYKSKSSGFVAKTRDGILRVKKEELFASALDCMLTCGN